jgi:hypothetical protein
MRNRDLVVKNLKHDIKKLEKMIELLGDTVYVKQNLDIVKLLQSELINSEYMLNDYE